MLECRRTRRADGCAKDGLAGSDGERTTEPGLFNHCLVIVEAV